LPRFLSHLLANWSAKDGVRFMIVSNIYTTEGVKIAA